MGTWWLQGSTGSVPPVAGRSTVLCAFQSLCPHQQWGHLKGSRSSGATLVARGFQLPPDAGQCLPRGCRTWGSCMHMYTCTPTHHAHTCTNSHAHAHAQTCATVLPATQMLSLAPTWPWDSRCRKGKGRCPEAVGTWDSQAEPGREVTLGHPCLPHGQNTPGRMQSVNSGPIHRVCVFKTG